MSEPEQPAAIEPGVRTDLAGEHDYGGYLALDRLLTSQRPVSVEP